MSEQADVVLRQEEWDELIATLEEREQALSVVGAERDEADRKFERCFDAYEQMLRERDAARAEAERLRAKAELAEQRRARLAIAWNAVCSEVNEFGEVVSSEVQGAFDVAVLDMIQPLTGQHEQGGVGEP